MAKLSEAYQIHLGHYVDKALSEGGIKLRNDELQLETGLERLDTEPEYFHPAGIKERAAAVIGKKYTFVRVEVKSPITNKVRGFEAEGSNVDDVRMLVQRVEDGILRPLTISTGIYS